MDIIHTNICTRTETLIFVTRTTLFTLTLTFLSIPFYFCIVLHVVVSNLDLQTQGICFKNSLA